MNLFKITCNDASMTIVYVVEENIEKAIAKFKEHSSFKSSSDIGLIEQVHWLVIV